VKTYKELRAEVDAKQDRLHQLFEGYPEIPQERVDQIQQANAELTDLGKQLDQAKSMDEAYQKMQAEIKERARPATGLPTPQEGRPDPKAPRRAPVRCSSSRRNTRTSSQAISRQPAWICLTSM
jgi:hypothetical protein